MTARSTHSGASTIAVWGAGGIGGVLAAWLVRSGLDVLVVDKDEAHVRAMQASGLFIDGVRGEFKVPVRAVLPDEVNERLDLVLLAVKCHHTVEAVDQLRPWLGADSTVVSVQNGLNEEVIAAAVGTDRTVGCFVNFGGDWQGPGHVRHGGEYPLWIGELDGTVGERIRRVRDVLARFHETYVTSNIWGYLWSKTVYASLLFGTALTGATIDKAVTDPRSGPVLVALVREAMGVADSRGVRLEALGEEFQPDLFRKAGWREAVEPVAARYRAQLKNRTGMWRDIAVRHRRTEVDCLVGATVAKGRELGIEMPLNKLLLQMVHELEEGRRAMGWANLDELAAATTLGVAG
jgi:2-dehydropantoate 2-reductase